MWTAKRVLLLVIGLCVCLCSYAVYAYFFGIIDGVAAFPIDKLPQPNTPISFPLQTVTDQKLELAFGSGCEEGRRPLKLWMPDKGIAFAFGDFQVDQKDGLVRLSPFSAALFHKGTGPNEHPEISIIKCDTAILTLDRPVSNYSELGSRKVIAIEMIGSRPGVTLASNRRTAEKNDDVDILIINGHVFYEERKNMIWTDGIVSLTDHQSKPPTTVRGKGFKMLLAKDSGINRTKTAAKGPTKARNDSNSVEKVILESNVEMRFWVDATAGFMGGASNVKKPMTVNPIAKGGVEKAQIHVHTAGSFVYDLIKENAWFESPAGRDGLTKGDDPLAPDQVHVQRLQTVDGKPRIDQLTCDRLDLQFRRKIQLATPASDRMSGGDKEIETAKATKRGKNDVTIAFESDNIGAYASEMYYRAADLVNGPMTTLKGEPLHATKDGHVIVCKELQLYAANRAGEGQKAWAMGPGEISLRDPKNLNKDPVFPVHVLWRDTLTVHKEREGNQIFDLLTVVGEASFIDDKTKQQLHGEKIMVWLRQTQDIAKDAQASGGSTKQELHRVYAQDRVRALSPEFIVRQTNRLTMSFLPQIAQNDRLPDLTPNANPSVSVLKPTPLIEEKVVPKIDSQPVVEEKKARSPIELQANDISVSITTLGTKNQLQGMIAKGNVIVLQAGDKPGEKRIDVTGQLLTVKKVGELGDVLVIHGEAKQLARLELGELILKGPIVTINQATNSADVDGQGVMEMPSNKNLDGTDTKNKKTRISIDFNKGMTFDGRTAQFFGGVQAREIGARSGLLCHELQATLDRTVSFKEGEKSGANAKIDRIVCDKNVYADDCKVDDKGQFVQRTILQGTVVSIHNEAGPSSTDIRGPGLVKLLARGSGDQGFGLQAEPNAPKSEPKVEWKLTHILFRDRMSSHTEGDAKIATFMGDYSGVEVFHFPTTKIEDKMDPDRPVKDGLFMRCEILQVKAEKSGERTVHTMIARRNVYFRTEQFLGYADVVKFDETNDKVIFEGLNGNPVRIFRMNNDGGGGQQPAFNGAKVLYNRKTGTLDAENVKSISN